MKTLNCLLLGLLLTRAAAAQTAPDSLTAALRYNPRSDMYRVRPATAPARPPAPPHSRPSLAAADSALAAALRRGDRPAEIAARLDLFDFYTGQNQPAQALAQLHRAQALVAQAGDRARLGRLLYVAGITTT